MSNITAEEMIAKIRAKREADGLVIHFTDRHGDANSIACGSPAQFHSWAARLVYQGSTLKDYEPEKFEDVAMVKIDSHESLFRYLGCMVITGNMYHLEDDASQIVKAITYADSFSKELAAALNARADEMYDLPGWTRDHCPIGVMMQLEEKRSGFGQKEN